MNSKTQSEGFGFIIPRFLFLFLFMIRSTKYCARRRKSICTPLHLPHKEGAQSAYRSAVAASLVFVAADSTWPLIGGM